jgi:uncharacterized protein YjiS (DUF1127 family)
MAYASKFHSAGSAPVDARHAAGTFGQHVARLAHKIFVAPIERWLEQERTIRELSRLSPRELAELGLSAGDIPYVAAGQFGAAGLDAEPAGASAPAAETPLVKPLPSNENRSSQRPSRVA